MGRFFPYLGGKTHLINDLLRLIPLHRVYCEVFGGSAELLFSKPRSQTEVYNDINGDLVNLFLVVRDHHEELIKRLEWIPQSREIYESWMREFKEDRAVEDPIERAARFYFMLCCQFGGKMYGGWAYGKTRAHWSKKRIKKLKSIHRRLNGVYIEHNDFRKVIKAWDHPDTFFFLDPPYLEKTGYTAEGFDERDHRDLAELLRKTEGKWLLTVGDHPLMWELYKDKEYSIDVVTAPLTAEKIDLGEKRGAYANLIIKNYEKNLSQSPLGMFLESRETAQNEFTD